jgi:nitrate reductase NapE component
LITFGITILLVVTTILALALGIVMGYGAIAGILWMFQHNRAEHATPALAHSTTGD